MPLKNKRIILGVTGAISAYKALELARRLTGAGAAVTPVMTASAAKFITPLTLSTLARERVRIDLFDAADESVVSHIALADSADLIIIAPATANTIGRIAGGLSDDLLSTVVMAAKAPVLVAPSMNVNMWENKIVAANVEKLKSNGYYFVGPAAGELACGYEGMGRLASVEDIVEAAENLLSIKDLQGEKVLVSAGPTREPIDPVRFVSNSSSGRMGYAIARAARRRGAEVVLISGPSGMVKPPDVSLVPVWSAQELYDACVSYYPQSTIVIMAAAVADYRPVKRFDKKLKKDSDTLVVEMERTDDVLKTMGKRKKKGQTLVGFALETDNVVENARKKLKDKFLDLVVANTPAGLDATVNQVTFINRLGEESSTPSLSKDEIADLILDQVLKIKG